MKAREMCMEAAKRRSEEIRAMEGDAQLAAPPIQGAGLSVESLTADTQGAGQYTGSK